MGKSQPLAKLPIKSFLNGVVVDYDPVASPVYPINFNPLLSEDRTLAIELRSASGRLASVSIPISEIGREIGRRMDHSRSQKPTVIRKEFAVGALLAEGLHIELRVRKSSVDVGHICK